MMNWYVIWTGWLLFLIVSFSALEGWALHTKGITLSAYTDIISQHWPVFICVYGMLFGGLAVHFWWHWAGPGAPGG